MTAAVLYGKEDLRLERVPVPHPGPGELVVRVGAALTCGTDLKVYRRGYHAAMLKPPIPFGHEVAGIVAEVGADVSGFCPGDRVVALNSAPCDHCFWCHQGQQNLCENLLFNNGAYAEYLRIPQRIVQKNTLHIPAATRLEHAALTEPLACVIRGLEESGAQPGNRIAVIGAGPIGLMFLHVAALSGLQVIAVVKRPAQGAAARHLGAVDVIDLSRLSDPVAAVRDLTPDHRGVDLAVDAVATPSTWQQAVAMVRRGGTVNFFGGPPAGTEVSLDTNRLHYDDITLKASFHHTPATVRTAFDLITSGRFQSADYVTGRATLADVPVLFARMHSRSSTAMPLPDHAPDEQGSGLDIAASAELRSMIRLDIKTAVLPAGVDL